ncbi:MAG TPA: FAD-dependent oxidoreductase [Actinomycetales bacterium]|nr:FAD-dependent oxidoreductase [Actinomycetales bacterium]
MADTYVVVGASLAGARAVEALRAAGDDAHVVLVGEEEGLPYERPPLSKGFLAGDTPREELEVLGAEWYAGHDVELRLGHTVSAVDRENATVDVGGEAMPYDKLLLTTGSAPVRLDAPGAELDGVHYLRSAPDSEAIRAAIDAGGPLVVVGGGWIGLEVAAVARGKGVDVTVVEPQPVPLSRVMGTEVGERWAALHRGHGVELLTGTTVAALRGDGSVEAVETGDGRRLPASAVVVGVGIRPRTELAEAAGLALDNGIAVDARLRTDDERVWAAGDVAAAVNGWAGRRLRVEHWANAHDQGAFAGRSMAGATEEWAVAPFFFTDQYDAGAEYWGWADPRSAQVVMRGTPDDGSWFAFWLDDGAVAAALHVNGWDDADAVKALVESHARVDPQALVDPGRALASLT